MFKKKNSITKKDKEISRLQHKEILLESIIKTLTQLYDEQTDENLELKRELMELKKGESLEKSKPFLFLLA